MLITCDTVYKIIREGEVPPGHWYALDDDDVVICTAADCDSAVKAAHECGVALPHIGRAPLNLTVNIKYKEAHINADRKSTIED